jgi:PAS domain-containing protein
MERDHGWIGTNSVQSQVRGELQAQYLRAIFDAIPLPAFIVDADVRIQDFNTAAEQFLGAEPASALYRRGGEAFHCIHAEMDGCGRSKPCRDCVIRRSVNGAMTGRATCRELHQAELRTRQGTAAIDLLVTASLLPYTEPPHALVILEDLGETTRIHKRGKAPRERGSTKRHP